MEKLKINDEVVLIRHSFGHTSYNFDKVVRLTATQAITGRGYRLHNMPIDWRGYVGYVQVGGSVYSGMWQMATPEIRKEYERRNLVSKVRRWLREKSFTDDEVIEIYEKYNQ